MSTRLTAVGDSRTARRDTETSAIRFEGNRLELPIILLGALAECEVGLDAFLERVRDRPLWQGEAIRSVDRRIVIQAHLVRDRLRCVIQIGRSAFYHHPSSELHVWHVALPATVMALREADPRVIIDERLLRIPGIRIASIEELNRNEPGMGVRFRLEVPRLTVWLPSL